MKIIKQAWKILTLLLFFTLLLSTTCTYDFQGGRADLDPLPDGISFEIKFILDPEKTVDKDGKLEQWVIDLFDTCLPWITTTLDENGMSRPPMTMRNINREVFMQFIDTPALDLFNAGFINRIRHHHYGGNQPGDVQLTYRRRISIPSGTTMTEEAVQAVYMQAKREGTFQWAAKSGISDSVEIDWSYNSAVMSFSRSVNGIKFNHPDTPPYLSLAGSKALLRDNFPWDINNLRLTNPRFDVADWYMDKIENGVIHGPVQIKRYRTRGTISAEDSLRLFGVEKSQRITLDVEVMPFFDTYIVELSSSDAIESDPGTSDYLNFNQVTRLRQFMHDICVEAGILVPISGLRSTQVIQNMRQGGGPKEP